MVEELLQKAVQAGEVQLADVPTAAKFCVYGQLGILLEDGLDTEEGADRIRAFLLQALHL